MKKKKNKLNDCIGLNSSLPSPPRDFFLFNLRIVSVSLHFWTNILYKDTSLITQDISGDFLQAGAVVCVSLARTAGEKLGCFKSWALLQSSEEVCWMDTISSSILCSLFAKNISFIGGFPLLVLSFLLARDWKEKVLNLKCILYTRCIEVVYWIYVCILFLDICQLYTVNIYLCIYSICMVCKCI